MKPELLFLILFLIGFILYCFLGNKKGFYTKIEGLTNNVATNNGGTNTGSTNNGGTNNGGTNKVGTNNVGTNNVGTNNNSSYENYNHYNGTSVATKYYGPNGESAIVNSSLSITVINTSGKSVKYVASNSSPQSNIEAITFIGPNGESATIVNGPNGGKAIKITDTNGNVMLYIDKPISSTPFIDPLSSYYGSTGNSVPNTSAHAYVSSPAPNFSTEPHTLSPSSSMSSSFLPNSYDYSNSLPQGVSKNQILPGQEDLYILKSQVVPPVCPACNPVVIYKDKECQSCPACARCPEPSFECKKVPNYNAINNEYLPTPVLTSFSGFGM